MSDKPTDDRSESQPPDAPSSDPGNAPTGAGVKRSDSEKASDREGQTREAGYDEA